MSKKIIAVNAGPRKGWNTDTLIDEAIKGAQSTGAEVVKFNLFRLEKYTGCVSCFGCKKEKYKGYCIRKDGLTEVLDAIREADGLIIGSPNYLGELTASFRALYERLIFQNLTYNTEVPCCNENPIVGPCEIFVSGETLQLKDYSKTDWPWFFNAEERYERHEKVFPKEKEAVFEKGKNLALQ